MSMSKKPTLLSAVMLGSLFLATGCGSSPDTSGASSPTTAVQDTSGDTSSASPSEVATTPAASPSPTAAPGKTIVLNLKSQEGYGSTLSLTVSSPVQYEGQNPPAPTEACPFTPAEAQGKYAYVTVTGELTPKTVNGFTWPSDKALAIDFISDGTWCIGDSLVKPGPLLLTAGTVETGWLMYEAEVTPNNPNGWDAGSPLPWSSIGIELNNGGGGTYTCTVGHKDAGYTQIADILNSGCYFKVGA